MISDVIDGGDDMRSEQLNQLREDILKQLGEYVVSTGSANAQILTIDDNLYYDYDLAANAGITEILEGHLFKFKAGYTNTGAMTLTIKNAAAATLKAATAVKDMDGNALTAGAIVAGNLILAWFDGTDFRIINVTLLKASQAEAEEMEDDTKYMTPAKTYDSIKEARFFGDGSDGDLTASTSITANSVKTNIDTLSSSGQKVLNVASETGFSSGDVVFIYQTQGTGAGLWELGKVDSVAAGELTLIRDLKNSYQATGAQVLKVPQYSQIKFDKTILSSGSSGSSGSLELKDLSATFATDGVSVGDQVWNKTNDTYSVVTAVSETLLNISRDIFSGGTYSYEISEHSLSDAAWDGTTGGIAVMMAKRGIYVKKGVIVDMIGKGFRGGGTDSKFQGEGYPGVGILSPSRNGNGGGGTTSTSTSAGGGGAGVEDGVAGLGQEGQSWLENLSYTFGDEDFPVPILVFGGGAGAGDGWTSGDGGGIIVLFAPSIIIAGQVNCSASPKVVIGGGGGVVALFGGTVYGADRCYAEKSNFVNFLGGDGIVYSGHPEGVILK